LAGYLKVLRAVCRSRKKFWIGVAVHANEPAPTCIALAQRALAAGPRIVPEPTDLPWFAQATVALVWADAHAEAQVPLDAGVAESRATGDPALFGMSLSQQFGETGTWALGSAMSVVMFIFSFLVIAIMSLTIDLRRSGFTGVGK